MSRRTVEVTHPDKVLFPDDGITKAELVDYYRDVARVMVPHVKDRPANLQRFPDGIGTPGFFQQAMPEYFPEWVAGVTVSKEGGELRHVMLQDAATLAYVANQGCITPHVWLSRRSALDRPDEMIFDVDPPEVSDGPDAAREVARALGAVLAELRLPAFVKTTGSRGYHVVVPLVVEAEFDMVRELAQQVAAVLAARYPDRVTVEPRKRQRGGRVYLDTLRNAYAHTAVPPFAVRARAGAPVAAPIAWEELDDPAMRADRFTLRTVRERLADGPDPWRGLRRRAVTLQAARGRVADLLAALAPSKVKVPRQAPPAGRPAAGSKRSVKARSLGRSRESSKPR